VRGGTHGYKRRMVVETLNSSVQTVEEVWKVLENVKDPEIPVLTVVDMGIITKVQIPNSELKISSVEITMTPTFVGCPAIGVMKKNIEEEVKKMGFDKVTVLVDYETRWTSDRMKPEAKVKLEKFGLAPPAELKDEELTEEILNKVRCPHCGSTDTTLRSSFGSTLCRAIRFCYSCKQGFEQFKPI
jgi:ring-1,2-phenylacetyl-CoA epoxidase subunit PaaD